MNCLVIGVFTPSSMRGWRRLVAPPQRCRGGLGAYRGACGDLVNEMLLGQQALGAMRREVLQARIGPVSPFLLCTRDVRPERIFGIRDLAPIKCLAVQTRELLDLGIIGAGGWPR